MILKNLKLERNLIKAKFRLDSEIQNRMLMIEREEIDFLLNSHNEPEMTYEELLALGEQIGTVSKGFSEEELEKLQQEKLESPQTCCICLVMIDKGCSATRLDPCGHFYDYECIATWLNKNKTCPVCLQEVLLD